MKPEEVNQALMAKVGYIARVLVMSNNGQMGKAAGSQWGFS